MQFWIYFSNDVRDANKYDQQNGFIEAAQEHF